MSTKEIVALLGHASLSGNVKKAIGELIGNDLIVFTIPEKPRSRLKKYGITESGRKVLKNTGSVWRNWNFSMHTNSIGVEWIWEYCKIGIHY